MKFTFFFTSAFLALSLSFASDNSIQVVDMGSEPNSSDPNIDIIEQVARSQDKGSLYQSILTGATPLAVVPQCEPLILESKILNSRTETERISIYKDYFRQCEKDLAWRSPKGLLTLRDFSLHPYEVYANSKVRRVKLTFSDTSSVVGHLAIKDNQPRPFIVVQLGIFSSGEPSSSSRNYLMSLFDQSPFNVLFLASDSSEVQIANNKRLLFGGHHEAIRAIEIGRWLKQDSPYRDFVSSVHMMGLSLGGQTALFSSLYNDHYQKLRGIQPFNSVMAICPVVRLEDTMAELFQSGNIKGDAAANNSWSILSSSRSLLPEIGDLYNLAKKPPVQFFKNLIGDASSRYYQRRVSSIGVPDFVESTLVDYPTQKSDYWFLNDFPFRTHNLQTPTMVWASQDDFVVNNPINAGFLENSELARNNPNLTVLNLKWGNHCAFNSVYSLPVTTSVLRSFVLAHSPEYQPQAKSTHFEFHQSRPASGEMYVNQEWTVRKNDSTAKLSFEILDTTAQDYSCRNQLAYKDPKCLKYSAVWLNFRQLPFTLAVPKTHADAEALTRWLNGNVRAVASDNLSLTGRRQLPTRMVWTEF